MTKRAEYHLPLFVGVVTIAAAVTIGITFSTWPVRLSSVLVTLVLVATLSEVLVVQYSSLSVSITYAICAAAFMLLGPSGGGLVAGLSTIPAAFVTKEKRLLRGLFNFSQLSLAGILGGWVYIVTGGRPLLGLPLTSSEIPHVLLPVTLLAVVSFVVNTTLVGVGASLMSGVPFWTVWKSNFAWTIPTQAAMTVLGLALAQVVASVDSVGLVLFIVPLMISRQLYERYVRLKSAYADTVRSLVAVIEAKDEYTRGHSERVAEYSVALARQLGFGPAQVERLELAALLHDLGKVGISRRILSKPGRLDAEEFRLIQQHPAIGARIVDSVPFLRDLVPLIAAHHERLDGSGYGEHLTADLIPLEARVLSTADAFDAMTSSRSYRPPLSRAKTLEELERGRGTQFDSTCVDALLECIDGGVVTWPSECTVEGIGANEAV